MGKGQLIRSRRSQLGISREELAERVGVSPTTVEAWEQGRRRPSPEAWLRLYEVFSVAAAQKGEKKCRSD